MGTFHSHVSLLEDTLWKTNIAMEKSPSFIGKSTINGLFSIAMLVYQMVLSIISPINPYKSPINPSYFDRNVCGTFLAATLHRFLCRTSRWHRVWAAAEADRISSKSRPFFGQLPAGYIYIMYIYIYFLYIVLYTYRKCKLVTI
jgi:hypothetical protein